MRNRAEIEERMLSIDALIEEVKTANRNCAKTLTKKLRDNPENPQYLMEYFEACNKELKYTKERQQMLESERRILAWVLSEK